MLRPLLDNRERAHQVRMMMYANLGIRTLGLIMIAHEVYLFRSLRSGVEFSQNTLELHDTMNGLVTIGGRVVLIVSAVIFIRWMLRAHRNYELAGTHSFYTSTAVKWAFFVPFINLYRPYQIIHEFFDGMREIVDRESGRVNLSDNRVIAWWWGLWITGGIFTNIIVNVIKNANTIESYLIANYLNALCGLIYMVDAWLVIRMVNLQTGFEEEYQALYDIQQLEGSPDQEPSAV